LAAADREMHEAVVNSRSEISDSKIQVIDLDTNEEITFDVILHDALKSTATLSRSRPMGYVLLPGHAELVEKLNALGFKLTELSQPSTFTVENYTITSYDEEQEKYEGTHRQNVGTEIKKLSKEFPAGSQVLLMDQPRSNLAIEIIEPEATNSFVSFGLLKVESGTELPIYRLQSEFIQDRP